jgi:prepilin-type N-terminal cleavage/methylation domain-containing protein
MNTRQNCGFTTLEILIVIVIIAILATFAVTRYIEVKDKGTVAAAMYDLDLVRKMLAYYSTDHGGFPESVPTYSDLKDQLVDPNGRTYGDLPAPYTFDWISYSLDTSDNYVIRVQVTDRHRTVLEATPNAVRLQQAR